MFGRGRFISILFVVSMLISVPVAADEGKAATSRITGLLAWVCTTLGVDSEWILALEPTG
jgi:hypothetical protein